MLRKLLRDFNTNRKIEINMENQSETLGYYYIKFDEDIAKLNRLIHSFDKNGVPLNMTYIDVEDTKLHYYPISIGQYGLAIFHSWLKTHSEEKRAHFLRIADWFMNNRTDHTELGCYWLTDVPKPEYHVYQPWKSAFAQSRGISMLLRAWQLTEDDAYLKVATQALIPFTKDITVGGVSVDRERGQPFTKNTWQSVRHEYWMAMAFAFSVYTITFVQFPKTRTPTGTHSLFGCLMKE